jgi:Flp pilus assembly protein TadG
MGERSMSADHPNGAGGVFRRLRRLLRDSCATVSIEFAFALPILCGMTFALYEVTEGVIAYMRVVDVANTVSDLIGQISIAQGGIGKQDFDNYYIAAQMVMSQTNGANLAVAVASVYYDVNGANPTVAWQIQRGGAGVISNATSFVSNLGTPNGSTIIVQATYTYQSALNYFITSPIVISSEVAGEPRNLLPPSYTQGIPCPPPSGLEPCS